jgi:hypothetical protein
MRVGVSPLDIDVKFAITSSNLTVEADAVDASGNVAISGACVVW